MRRGITAFRATGSVFFVPYFLGLLAEQYGKIGRVERGLTLVSEALAAVERTGERWYEAELYRCRGALLLARDEVPSRPRPPFNGRSASPATRPRKRSSCESRPVSPGCGKARPGTPTGANSSSRGAPGLMTALPLQI